MSTTYITLVLEEARLNILQLLAEAPDYASNSSILDMALDQIGLSLSRDQVDAQLAWLAEQGLVTTEKVSTLLRAALTARGVDVASGQAKVPGVKRPAPRV